MVDVVSVRLRPASMQSMLSRRSTVTRASSGSMSIVTLIGIPSGTQGSTGSCASAPLSLPLGSARMASMQRRSE